MLTKRNIILILLLGFLIIMTLKSCKYAEITDLVHKDTDGLKIENTEIFNNPKLEQYQINGILFMPYTRQNPYKTYEDKYFNYSLRLAVYRKTGNQDVIINHVTVDGIKNVKFNKISKNDLHKELKFSNHGSNEIQRSGIILIEEINDYDMELNDKSQIRVVLNVSVKENGKVTTRDLEYIFEPYVRKYLYW